MSRKIEHVINAIPASDGAGVKLKRVINSNHYRYTNPFVMLDEFGSDDADDYIAGFPSHPHKGFDTISFMLNGTMTHKDSTGNEGKISDNEVQWMRTGSGIIHSEMPAQTAGKMRGMQFWLNVPKKDKSEKPDYVGYATELTKTEAGNSIRVIAGNYANQKTPFEPQHTQAQILYIVFDENNREKITLPNNHNAMVYVLSGKATIEGKSLQPQQLGVLSTGSEIISIEATKGSEVIIFSGYQIDEPMVQHGPFVMNTMKEIEETIRDYQMGRFL